MSDLPIEPPVPEPTDSPDPGASSDPVADPASPDLSNAPDVEFLALVEKLGPVFNEIAKAAIDGALEAMPRTSFKPGTVASVQDFGKVAVRVDGDDNPIDVQVIGETPMTGQRVMVSFVPPSSVFVLGVLDGFAGVPPGSLVSYTAPIAVDAQTSMTTQDTPPFGWLWPHGQITRSNLYPLLFQRIGTAYNTGGENAQNGEFRVPDMRGRMPLGLDNMGGSDAGRVAIANVLGTTGGTQTHTTPLPAHTHTQPTHTHTITAHTHTQPTHTHSEAAHTHGAGSFTAASHTHSMGSHVHAESNHAHGVSGSVTAVGDHSHFYGDVRNTSVAQFAVFGGTGMDIAGDTGRTTGGAGGHSHTFSVTSAGKTTSTNTGAASGTTGGAGAAVSGTSATGGGGTTGSGGGDTTGSSGGGSTSAAGGETTGSAGVAGITVDHLPPFLAVHWLIKA